MWGSLGTPSPFSPWPGPLRVFSPDITTRGPGEAEGIGGAVHGRGVGADFGKLGHVPGMGPEDGHAPPCQEQQRERTRMGRKPGRGTGAEVTSYGVSCPPPHPQASAHLRGTAVIGRGTAGVPGMAHGVLAQGTAEHSPPKPSTSSALLGSAAGPW